MRSKNPYLVTFSFMVDWRQRDKLAELAKTEQRSTAAKLRAMIDEEVAFQESIAKRAA